MPTDVVGMIVRGLAAVVCGVVGGLVLGFAAVILSRVLTGRKLPQWLHWTFRLLGCGLAGWLAWLYVPTLGWGPGGGPGGPHSGGKDAVASATDDGKGPGKKDDKDAVKDKKEERKKPPTEELDGQRTPDSANAVGVEVLTKGALERLKPGTPSDHCYRLWKGSEFLTLAQVKQRLQERLQDPEQPPLRTVFLVFYKDSPDHKEADNIERVSDLKQWAATLKAPADGKPVQVVHWLQTLKDPAPPR
jgi:hypothetical protein